MLDSTATIQGQASVMLRTLARQLTTDLEDPEHRALAAQIAAAIREESGEAARLLDEFWISELARQRTAVRESAQQQDAVRELLETLTRPPLRVGTFLGSTPHGGVPTACVHHEGTMLIVGFGDDAVIAGLEIGQEVLLSDDRHLLVGSSPYRAAHCGETAVFSRTLDDERLVLRWQDEEVLVRRGGDLDPDALRDGDHVLWNSRLRIALEKIERPTTSSSFLEETPDETFADVGGLDAQIEQIQRSLRMQRDYPEVAARYHLRSVGSMLLVGPPGTGKTLIARAFANWLAQLAPSRRSRFMNIKPASLHSKWYAQSEANYREAFRVAREAGRSQPDVPVVMFFDEIDAVGASRAPSPGRVDDRILTAFMAELDGLEERGNILVVAATNRRSALDPALLRPGRLGDLIIEVPRPNRGAAVEIFERHLAADIPYRGPRREAIEVAVSRMYAPNAAAALAILTLRDGTRRTVTAGDLVSGAALENIARLAVERACAREIEGGSPGVATADLLEASAAEFETAARALTPLNAASFIGGLPQDIDVVRVEPIAARARRVHRYREVA